MNDTKIYEKPEILVVKVIVEKGIAASAIGKNIKKNNEEDITPTYHWGSR